jgi:hypothetical protein
MPVFLPVLVRHMGQKIRLCKRKIHFGKNFSRLKINE